MEGRGGDEWGLQAFKVFFCSWGWVGVVGEFFFWFNFRRLFVRKIVFKLARMWSFVCRGDG